MPGPFSGIAARFGPFSRHGMTMQPLTLCILVVVAGVCGALGKAIVGSPGGGIIVTIATGFIGALVGIWLARLLQLPEVASLQLEGANFPIVWSIAGSALFVALISAFAKSEKKK
jgi:uncharacterized membrane protein YeaQ/YmgE (transglycosylase-associated protein family)